MKAAELTLQALLEGKKQYMVPLFQRPYSWQLKNCRALWTDVLETYELGEAVRHFLGAVVTKAVVGGPGDVARHLVIDGQQRLTTLTILLAALRDTAAATDPELASELGQLYVTNQFTKGDMRFKLLPTQADRAHYAAIALGAASTVPPCLMREAYDFFSERLTEPDSRGKQLDLGAIKAAILGRLEIVSVWLESQDNEYRIFESLNGKGRPLSQADLVRNFVFMRLPVERHEDLYARVWLPMQESLRSARGHDDDLELFFRYQLMSEGQFVASPMCMTNGRSGWSSSNRSN